MKKIVFVFSVFLFSCTDTTEDIYFMLHNDTDKSVLVRAFKGDSLELVDVISIQPYSAYRKKQRMGYHDTQSMAFYSDYGVDSVRVIFNGSRVTVYTGNNDQNINLEIIYGNNREYHITNEDFSKSIECNNECE